MKTITNTSYIKYLLLLAVLLLSGGMYAQDDEEAAEEKKFSFSGSVDAYYRTAFNGLNSTVPVLDDTGAELGEISPSAPGTSFANDAGCLLYTSPSPRDA